MTGSLRVLHVINGLGTGGAERSLAELLPLLDERGVESRVAYFFDRQEGIVTEIDVPWVLPRVRARSILGRAVEVRRLIRETQAQLVHTTLFEADLVGRLASLGLSTKVLTSIVNTSYDPRRYADPHVRPWRLRLVQALDGWTARHMGDHAHTLTEAVKASAMSDLGLRPESITVIPRARDLTRLGTLTLERRASARQALAVAEETTLLVSIGRQEHQKGHLVLIEATAELAAHDPTITLLVAGRRGTATDQLFAAIDRLGLSGNVQLLGHRTDVPELLAAADVFVFPSLYEGLGGSLLEAMALGLPVASTSVPAIEEVVANYDRAWLAEPGDRASLVAAITAALASRRAAHGEIDPIVAMQWPTDADVADATAGLYRRIVDGTSDSSC